MAVTEYVGIHGARLGIGSKGQLVVDGSAVKLHDDVTIALAASATTDGMDITIKVVDGHGATVTGVHALDVYMSESSAGVGLTADAYSGDLTASVGAILTAWTAKKHWRVVTAATGIFTATLVDSANPADQYVVVKRPVSSGVIVSVVSGTNWQGA